MGQGEVGTERGRTTENIHGPEAKNIQWLVILGCCTQGGIHVTLDTWGILGFF